jgi:hypothetical protein
MRRALCALLLSACAAGPSATSAVVDADDAVRAWIRCYAAHGIRAVPEGKMLRVDDAHLSRADAATVSAECEAELAASGVLGPDPLSSAQLKATYALFEAQHSCLAGKGYQLPVLVSLDAYLADPNRLVPPLQSVQQRYGDAAHTTAQAECANGSAAAAPVPSR